MIHILVTLKCDQCGAVISTAEPKGHTACAESVGMLKDGLKDAGGMVEDRPYRRSLHYCPTCADGGALAAILKRENTAPEGFIDWMESRWPGTKSVPFKRVPAWVKREWDIIQDPR